MSSKGREFLAPYARKCAASREIIRRDPHICVSVQVRDTYVHKTPRPCPTRRHCALESGGRSFLAGGSPSGEQGGREGEGNAEKQSRLSWSSEGRIA